MVLQQLSFGGVSRVSYCSRCKKPLSNPASVEAGMGPICRSHGDKDMETCKREEFADGWIDGNLSLNQALVLQRDGDNDHAIVRTNVPHLVVHHSPSGFEFGYGGSGPADLALNVCQFYLNSIGYQGMKTDCFDGCCWSLAWVLHQEFKRTFIASAPHKGINIPMSEIKAWFEAHITEDMVAAE
jgi:hypothetical protein